MDLSLISIQGAQTLLQATSEQQPLLPQSSQHLGSQRECVEAVGTASKIDFGGGNRQT